MKEDELQKRLGKNLKKIRHKKGLSQEDFADLLGFHRTYMGALERGERNISLKSLVRIAETLGVEAVELLERFD